ncbi:MAG: hypothetical protein WCR12_02070 [Dysgonamonadaceae bacterium]
MNIQKIIHISILAFLPLLAFGQQYEQNKISVNNNDSHTLYNSQQNEKTLYSDQNDLNFNPIHQKRVFEKSKIRYGANLGLSFSRNYSVFNLGPQVGYQFNEYFMSGTGIKYYYTKIKNTSGINRNHQLGFNLFGYTYPVKFITLFTQAELNYLWSNYSDNTSGITSRNQVLVPSIIVGGGLRFGRSHLTLNYDIIHSNYSPYPKGFFTGVSVFF